MKLVSADMAGWISGVRRALPGRRAVRRPVPRRVLATEALDKVRREVWNEARRKATSTRRRAQGRPVRALEEPREPHRPPALKLADRDAKGRCTARTCSRSSCARSTPAGAEAALLGMAGLGASLPPAPFVKLARTITEQREGSSPRSTTASPTPASRRSTPRSDSSPDARSGSTPRGADRPRNAQARRAVPATTGRSP